MQQQQQSAPMSAPVGEVPAGSAMVYMPFQTRSKICDRYKHKQSIGLGATQIIIGILCIIFNSVSLGVTHINGLASVGHGYWCGILFTITGIFGIIAGKKKTKCQIITFMVLCIISAAFTIALLVVGIIGALTAQYYYRCPSYDYGYHYDPYPSYPSYRRPCSDMANYRALVAMESLLAISGLVEAIVAIWASTLCCRSGICCSSPMIVLPSAGYFPNSGQMIYISQTQGGQYVYSPQPIFSHNQGTTPPPGYVQPDWVMPTTNIGPVFGQAPPEYMANQAQPLWMIPPSTTSQGFSAAQALSTDPAGNEMKKNLNVDEC